MRYVALLRGINVGGNNKLAMSDLKALFEHVGFSEVSTYINSGNIFFTDNLRPSTELSSLIEAEITKEFGLNIPVLVRSKAQIDSTLKAMPTNWQNDQSQKADVLFLWNEIDTPDAIELLAPKEGVDQVIYNPGAVLWRIDRADINKSGLQKLVGTKTYKLVTVRNVNTLRAIAQRL